MSDLRVYDTLEQRSPEWFEARLGILTASAVGKLLTPTSAIANNDTSRGLTHMLAAERITGFVVPTFQSDAMFRGVMDEPLARDLYSKLHAPAIEVGFMVREIDGHKLGYSPDGLVGDDGLIEVKSAEPKIHLARILSADVPREHMAQMQAGMLVSGRKWCDFVSYCGGMPMHVQRVHAIPEWFATITEALAAFEDNVADSLADYARITDGLPTTERIDYSLEMDY